jgi:hypothetical protein
MWAEPTFFFFFLVLFNLLLHLAVTVVGVGETKNYMPVVKILKSWGFASVTSIYSSFHANGNTLWIWTGFNLLRMCHVVSSTVLSLRIPQQQIITLTAVYLSPLSKNVELSILVDLFLWVPMWTIGTRRASWNCCRVQFSSCQRGT